MFFSIDILVRLPHTLVMIDKTESVAYVLASYDEQGEAGESWNLSNSEFEMVKRWLTTVREAANRIEHRSYPVQQ